MANIPQTSFTTPNYDYGADISQIERRRALAQAMQKESMSTIDIPQAGAGQFQARISPFQALAKIGEAYAGKRQQDKADIQQRELAAKTQRDLADVLRRGQIASTGNPQDMTNAASIYMQHPQTAPLGHGMLQEQMKQRMMAQAIAGATGGSTQTAQTPGGGIPPGAMPQQPQPSPMNPQGPNPSVMAGSGPVAYQPPPTPVGPPPQGPQGLPQAPQANAGIPAGVDPMAWRLAVAKGDLGELAKMVQTAHEKATTPIVERGYGIKVFNPATGKYELASNPEDITAVEEAKLKATQKYEPPIKLNTSGGQEIQLSRPEYVDYQKTGQLPARYGKGGGAPAPAGPTPVAGPQPIPVGPGSGLGAGGLPPAPSAVRPPAQGLGVPGLSQSQQDIINQARQTAGGKAADEQFAKDYVSFNQGGAQDAAKQIAQLRDVSSALKDPKANLTGTLVGNMPEAVNTIVNPKSVAMRERVEEVVQRSLRAILGAQFTEKEGERLIARAYNPRLSEKENAVRVDRLLTQLEGAYKSKVDASKYFEKNGTLEGFRGKMPSMGDFDPESKSGAGASATIKFSDLP